MCSRQIAISEIILFVSYGNRNYSQCCNSVTVECWSLKSNEKYWKKTVRMYTLLTKARWEQSARTKSLSTCLVLGPRTSIRRWLRKWMVSFSSSSYFPDFVTYFITYLWEWLASQRTVTSWFVRKYFRKYSFRLGTLDAVRRRRILASICVELT